MRFSSSALGQIVTERFLDHDSRIGGAAGFRQAFGNCAKQAGRHRQIMQWPLSLAQLLAQFGESCGVAVVAVDIAQQADELLKRALLQTTVLFQAVFGALFELIQRPARFGNADDGDVESFVANQILQRGKNLFVG